MEARNAVCQVEAIYLYNPSSWVERRTGWPHTRDGGPPPSADASLREARHSIEPINGNSSTSMFLVSKCSTTSGKSSVQIHLS